MPNDYILRSDVEKLLNQTISEIENPNRERVLPDMQYQAMKEVLVAFLSELSSIQSVDRWIPVDKRYPEVGAYVLCLNSKNYIQKVCQYIGDGYFEYSGEYEMKPTHWTHLPPNTSSHEETGKYKI